MSINTSPGHSLGNITNILNVFIVGYAPDPSEQIKKSKVGNRSRGRPEGSFFNRYYTEMYGRALLFSLIPLICTLYRWVLSKKVSSTIFKVFGMTRPGIETRSPGPLVNTILFTKTFAVKTKKSEKIFHDMSFLVYKNESIFFYSRHWSEHTSLRMNYLFLAQITIFFLVTDTNFLSSKRWQIFQFVKDPLDDFFSYAGVTKHKYEQFKLKNTKQIICIVVFKKIKMVICLRGFCKKDNWTGHKILR